MHKHIKLEAVEGIVSMDDKALIASCQEQDIRKITCAKTLRLLSRNGNGNVRADVAENPNTPVPLLTALGADHDRDVRRAVAANPHTPPDMLVVLGKRPSKNYSFIHENVAENPSTPPDLLHYLAKDEERSVRMKVALNPHTETRTLAMMVDWDVDPPTLFAARNAMAQRQKIVPFTALSHAETASKIMSDLEHSLRKSGASEGMILAAKDAREQLTAIAKVADGLAAKLAEKEAGGKGRKL